MKGKIFKWTAALAVALTMAGGAAGLSPSPVSLSDYSITAEAASHYSFDKQTHQLTLSGTFTFSEDDLASALGNYTASGVDSLKLKEGANVTFDEHLSYYLPSLTYVCLSKATVNYTDSSGGFLSYMKKLQTAKLEGTIFNGSWYWMFRDCPRLVTADLEISYDSRAIDTLESCFKGCSMLQNIYWNNNFQAKATNVTNMSYMFDSCSSLTSESLMNIARLSNNKLYNARAMFRNCSSLTELRLWDMNLSNVGVIDSMFEGCSSLETLNLSGLNANNFDFTNYNRWEKMFLGCTSLHTLKLPANFQIRSKMGLPNSREGCTEELTGWALSNDLYTSVTDAARVYFDSYVENIANQKSSMSFTEPFTLYRRGDWIDKGSCYYYDRVNYVLHLFGNVDDDEVMYMDNAKYVTEVWCEEGTVFPYHCFKLFAHRPNLKKVDINNADTSQVGDMSYMFTHDPSLVEVNAGKIDTSNVYTMAYMFESCTSLKYFNYTSGKRWNTKNVKYFDGMFAYCTSLREVDANFESNVITSVEGMFNNCGNLEMIILDENGFDLRGVADAKKANMFADCPNLTSLYLSSNFGGITQNMKLRNDGGGWCDPMWNGIQVSGTAQYAEIDTSASGNIYHAEMFSVINLDQTFTVSDAPVVGFKSYGLEEGVTCNSTAFKINKNLSGWYDATTDKKMKTEFFQPGGHYYLRILLDPEWQCRFDGITAENIAKIKLKFTYRDKQFADVVAAGVTENGLLDIYAVVDSGSKTSAISMTKGSFGGQQEYCHKKKLTNNFVFKYDDSHAQQHILPCYTLAYLSCYGQPLETSYYAYFLLSTYLEYVGLEMDDYEYSIGGRAYQPFTDWRRGIPSGVLPGINYTFSVRMKGQSKPFREWIVVGKSIGEPAEGEYLEATDVKHFDIAFSAHTVALNNNLGCVYYVPAADLEGYENVKVIIQKESYDENGKLFYTTEEIKNYTIKDSGYGDEYIFEYKKIAAKEIASNLYAVIYAEKDGNVYTNMYDRFSVVDYAMNKLNSAETSRALAVLCADMLNYGAAAQTHFGYHTSNLANSTMTAAHQALATDPNTLQLKSDTKVVPLNGTATAKFSGKTLELGNNISLVFLMQFDDDVDKNNVSLKLSYKTITGQSMSDTIPFSEFEKCEKLYQGKPEYRYSYNRVRAKDAAQPVTATILINGKPASDTLTYSVQSYAKAQLDNSETSAKLKTIIKALMVYCKSAEAYFKS